MVDVFFILLPLFLSLLIRPWQSASVDNLFVGPPNANPSKPASLHVLLLTAHPDDECMFFAPTLLALQRENRLDIDVSSLCLSVGDADGLGQTRRHELARSLDVLGVTEDRRWVVDIPELQDNFTASWDAQIIADVLAPHVQDQKIDMILTFDHHGVSGHPNHNSLPYGVTKLLSTLPPSSRPCAYTLRSVPLAQKYIGAFAPLLSKFKIWSTALLPNGPLKHSEHGITFTAGVREYVTALRAMMQHRSQLVWFRWLYVSFSRYMWVNDLVPLLVEPVSV